MFEPHYTYNLKKYYLFFEDYLYSNVFATSINQFFFKMIWRRRLPHIVLNSGKKCNIGNSHACIILCNHGLTQLKKIKKRPKSMFFSNGPNRPAENTRTHNNYRTIFPFLAQSVS